MRVQVRGVGEAIPASLTFICRSSLLGITFVGKGWPYCMAHIFGVRGGIGFKIIILAASK